MSYGGYVCPAFWDNEIEILENKIYRLLTSGNCENCFNY